MAENTAPRRLDEAPRAGGLTYTASGTAIDSEGRPLKDAPKRPADTQPQDQPHAKAQAAQAASLAGGGTAGLGDLEKLGAAIARGLTSASAQAEATTTATDANAKLAEGAKNAQPEEGKRSVGQPTRGDVSSGKPPKDEPAPASGSGAPPSP